MIAIRPSKLFHLVEEEGPERVVQIRIPKRRNPEGPDRSAKLLETMVLLACCKIAQAVNVFEFGTCLGSTALNLALNGYQVHTLDLDLNSAKAARQSPNDRETTAFHLSHPMEWERFAQNSILKWRITPLYGDSTRLALGLYADSMDLVWIDGGHDYQTLASDTANAFGMIRQNRQSVIAWHDYANPETPDVTRFLDELSAAKKLYWIEDTFVVLHFNRPVEL